MKGERMKERSLEEKLDYAVKQLEENLLLWGIDNWVGSRCGKANWKVHLSMTVKGATNLVTLVNTLNAEIERLNTIIEEKSLA